jgi:hypothetical protein
MVQNPGRLGSFGLGLGYEGRWYEGIRITRHETTVTGRVNDTVIDSTTILDDPADVNRMVGFDFETNVGFLDVPFGIWAGDLGWGRLQVGGSALIGGGGVRLTFLDRESGDRTEFDGETVILGLGLEAVLVPCPEPCPWFVALGFAYRTDVDTSVRRKPSPSEPGFAFDDEVELGHEGWTVSARGGYVLRPRARFLRSVAPWIGLQYDRLEVTVSERTLVTSPQFPGRSVTVDFRAEFESESVQGLVGVDAHLWGPFFARLAVAFDDCDVAVLTKLVYAFGVAGR